MENKVANTIESVYTGSLADNIKNNSRYIMTGIVFGAVTGAVVGGFFGKSKLVFALIGAVGFGASGYLLNNKKTKTSA